MQQAQQKQDQAQPSPVEVFAESILDLDDMPEDFVMSEDGSRITYEGHSFNYELAPMYQDAGSLNRTGAYSAYIPNAADDGDPNEITIESVSHDGQSGIVIYDVFQPGSYSDEDWVCTGSLTLILTDAENHETRLKEEVDHAKAEAKSAIKSQVFSLLKNAAVSDDLAGVVKEILSDLANDARYVFDKDKDDVHSSGDIDSARAIAEAGNAVREVLDSSFAGACVAELMIRHPLVESFTLELTTTQEYDDNNYFTARNANVADLMFMKGVSSVTMEDFGGDEFDPAEYADYILDEIRDQSIEYDLHCGFAGSDERTEDLDVKVSRTALKHLLDSDQVDGLAVAKILHATMSEA